jgi:hypothetical protein
LTVSVAGVVVAVLHVLVKSARYWLPLCDADAENDRFVDVAPPILFQSDPPLVLTCHCTVGVGEPLAAALNVAVPPVQTDWFDGFAVIPGDVFTVRVAGLVVAVLHILVKSARYWLPLCPADVVNERLVLVAPPILFQSDPPLVLICHCTEGVGEPLAAALNVAVPPAQTD